MRRIIIVMIITLVSSKCIAQLSLFVGGGGGINPPNNRIYKIKNRDYFSGYHEVYDTVGYHFSAEIGISYQLSRHYFTLKIKYLNCTLGKHAYYYSNPIYNSKYNYYFPSFPSTMITGYLRSGFYVEKVNFIQIPICYGYSVIKNKKRSLSLTPYLGWVYHFFINSNLFLEENTPIYSKTSSIGKGSLLGSVQLGARFVFHYFYVDISDMIRVIGRTQTGGSFHQINLTLGTTIFLNKKTKQ